MSHRSKIIRWIFCLAYICSLSAPAHADSAGNSDPLTHIPRRAAGFIAGAVVGTPICFLRRLKINENDGIQGMVGDTTSPILRVPAGLFWLPLATIASAMEAPVYAIKNSWMSDMPFSKQQFSIDD